MNFFRGYPICFSTLVNLLNLSTQSNRARSAAAAATQKSNACLSSEVTAGAKRAKHTLPGQKITLIVIIIIFIDIFIIIIFVIFINVVVVIFPL